MKFLVLILSLPTENATVRMRAWRALKTSGAAVLRDGVYLMPETEACRQTLTLIADDVNSGGGTAHLLHILERDDSHFPQLFDRSEQYTALTSEVQQIHLQLSAESVQDALKQVRKLRKTFANIVEIDFFPNNSRQQAGQNLQNLELDIACIQSPNEPLAVDTAIIPCALQDYQKRLWATRRRPWVDRLASAWLIKRFIDPYASFLWLASPNDYPNEAIGFDFDNATFSHIGQLVTFEVLMASFALDKPALKRLAGLVHYLDVGGLQPPEALGVESVLSGLRDSLTDDDQLLNAAIAVFDSLLTAFAKGNT